MPVPDQTLFAKRLRERGYTDAQISEAREELHRIVAPAQAPGADAMAIYDQYAAFVARYGLTLDEVAYDDDAVKADEFDEAYELLVSTLAAFGTNSYQDDGAYFIVDDNYGTRELLVEVTNTNIDWPRAKQAIAAAFGGRLPAWSVIIRAQENDEKVGPFAG